MFKIINKTHITAVLCWGRESERCQTRLRITRVLRFVHHQSNSVTHVSTSNGAYKEEPPHN